MPGAAGCLGGRPRGWENVSGGTEPLGQPQVHPSCAHGVPELRQVQRGPGAVLNTGFGS